MTRYVTVFNNNYADTYKEGLNINSDYEKITFFKMFHSDRSLFLFSKENRLRIFLKYIINKKAFKIFIILTIAANCLVLALETPLPQNDATKMFKQLDSSEGFFVLVFLIECIMKIIANGFVLNRKAYLRSYWNILDFLIVIIGVVSYLIALLKNNAEVDIKIIRAFRILRPIRLVSILKEVQFVLSSLVLSLRSLTNVFFLVIFLITMYAIIGMHFFMGKLKSTCYNNVTLTLMENPTTCGIKRNTSAYYCTDLAALPSGQKWVCLNLNSSAKNVTIWSGPNYGITNFDNILWAMLTVFQTITKQGWSDILYWVNDSVGKEWPWIYFVSLISFGSYLIMNLTLGVLSGNFLKQSSKLNTYMKFLKENKRQKEESDFFGYKKWIDLNENEDDVPQSASHDEECRNSSNICTQSAYKSKLIKFNKILVAIQRFLKELIKRSQYSLHGFIKGKPFFILIIVLVFLNTVIMATEFSNQPTWLTTFQDSANIVFIILFTIESALKIFAFGVRGYFSEKFNIFDFVIILCSIIELCLIKTNVIKHVGVVVLRCARLLRIFKLTRLWSHLNKLMSNMFSSVVSSGSLLLLLSLFMIIFSLLGTQIFGGKFTFTALTRPNFDTFGESIFSIFQMTLGQDWNLIMYDGIRAYNNNALSGLFAIYFVFVYIIGNYIFLNVFLAIALNNLSYLADTIHKKTKDTSNIELKPISETDCSTMSDNTQSIPMGEIHENPGYSGSVDDVYSQIENDESGQVIFEEFDDDSDSINQYDLQDNNEEQIEKIIKMPVETSFFIFKKDNKFRKKCYEIVNHGLFKNVIMSLIIISSLMLALEDPLIHNSRRNYVLFRFDDIFTGFFTLEILIKMVAYGLILHKNAFLRNGLNWIDLIVVVTGLIGNILTGDSLIAVVKIFRMLRVLRPIRAITGSKGLQRLLYCLITAIKAIGMILIIALLLQFIFAVIGVIVLKGSFYSCTDVSKVTNNRCKGQYFSYSMDSPYTMTAQNRVWSNFPFNYDNVANAMITLFVISTFNGWKTFLFKTIDSTGENMGPYYNNRPATFIFYLIFIIAIALIVFNIFISMIIISFRKEKESEHTKYELDKNQCTCINYVLNARPVAQYVPRNYYKYKVWRIISSNTFHFCVLSLIMLNTFCLSFKYAGQSILYANALKYLNDIFIVLFTIEIILKIYAFGIRNYLNDEKNIFDVLVVLGSYIDMAISFLPINDDSAWINIFRLFRVLRLLRFLSRHRSIQQLLSAFIKSLKAVPYVFLLIILTFFMYGTIGMQLFGRIGLNNTGSLITKHNNFQTFPESILLLFRSMTGESWNDVMISCIDPVKATCYDSKNSCGSVVAYFYFTTFLLICCFLILNLFVAVILENFDFLTRDKSILGIHHLEEFVDSWTQYDLEASGRIKYKDLVNMLSKINPPVGFGVMSSEKTIFKNLIKMNVPLQSDGTILFKTILFSLVRNNLKINIFENEFGKKITQESNDQLRTIVQSYWKNIEVPLLNEIIPLNFNKSVTIGKLNATFVIEKILTTTIIKNLNSTEDLMTDNQENIDNLQPSTSNSELILKGEKEFTKFSDFSLTTLKNTYKIQHKIDFY